MESLAQKFWLDHVYKGWSWAANRGRERSVCGEFYVHAGGLKVRCRRSLRYHGFFFRICYTKTAAARVFLAPPARVPIFFLSAGAQWPLLNYPKKR